MKYGATLTALAVMATATTAVAQDGTISQSFLSTVPLGNVAAFEEAYLRHVDWHRNQNDPWRWDMWQTATGELGTYVVITDGHTLADFDSPPFDPAADGADAMEQFGSLVSTVNGAFVRMLPDVSNPGGTPDEMPLAQVIEFTVEGGREADFVAAVRTYHEALNAANWEQHYEWLANVSGGTAQFILVLHYANHADMAPPARSLEAVMEEALGRQEADLWSAMFDDIVESTTERLWMYRPDLSYVPGM